jgi:hypothetical protein
MSGSDVKSWEAAYDNVDGIVHSVKCIVCGTLHDANGKTFARLWGGLLEGISGGLLGGMTGSTYYCKPCFVLAAAKALGVQVSVKPDRVTRSIDPGSQHVKAAVDVILERSGFIRGIDPGSTHEEAPTGEPGEDSWETRACTEMGR